MHTMIDEPVGMGKLVSMSKQYCPAAPARIWKPVAGGDDRLQEVTETSPPGDAIPSLNVTVMPASTSAPFRKSTSQGPGQVGADSATQLSVGTGPGHVVSPMHAPRVSQSAGSSPHGVPAGRGVQVPLTLPPAVIEHA